MSLRGESRGAEAAPGGTAGRKQRVNAATDPQHQRFAFFGDLRGLFEIQDGFSARVLNEHEWRSVPKGEFHALGGLSHLSRDKPVTPARDACLGERIDRRMT